MTCFELGWEGIRDEFAIAKELRSAGGVRERGERIDGMTDPVADFIETSRAELIRGYGPGGELQVQCPWSDEHSGDSGPSESVWFLAATNGYEHGAYRCLHGHCAERGASAFEQAIGFIESMFDDLGPLPEGEQKAHDDLGLLLEGEEKQERCNRLRAIPAGEFAKGAPPEWIVKGVLPKAALGMIFGRSGAGKSFFALDLAAAIAHGIEWRGRRVRQANVLYICAEGTGGFRNRIKAYTQHHCVKFGDAFQMIPAAPNFLTADDPNEIINEARRISAGVIFVDTLAQVTPGGDENSSTEMGKALAQCRRLHEETGAIVVLVHHAGKDASKGARGWSGIRAAADVEIEVAGDAVSSRQAKITKMKDGQEGEVFGFKLVTIPLGIDEDGDLIESCVVEPAEIARKMANYPIGNPGLVWAAYHALVKSPGEVVDIAKLLDAAIAAFPLPMDGKRNSQRQQAKRAYVKLCVEGWLVEEAGQVRAADARRADVAA